MKTNYQEEPETKTIYGRMVLIYKFKTEVPKDWDEADIKNDMWENTIDYQQDLDDIDLDI